MSFDYQVNKLRTTPVSDGTLHQASIDGYGRVMVNSEEPCFSFAITPSNSTILTGTVNKAIWVGGAGNVAIMLVGDLVATTLTAVPAGTRIVGNFARVMATNTTATLIVGFGS